MPKPTCIELFAGAGGASLGLHRAGFKSLFAAEWDHNACETHRVADMGKVVEGDVRDLDADLDVERPLLMWASPPCQAFSSAGKRLGALDERNGWPWTLDILDEMERRGNRPEWVICENVPGLSHHKGGCNRESDYDPIADMFGEEPAAEDDPFDCPGCYWERWVIPEFEKRFAHVSIKTLDAANWGTPQRRRRVFLVAGPRPFNWPKPTHSLHNLVYDKWVSGVYWEKHGMTRPTKGPSKNERAILESFEMKAGRHEGAEAWLTVRDALGLSLPIRHQSPSAATIQRLPDEVAPAVSGKGTLYEEPDFVEGSVNPHYPNHDLAISSPNTRSRDRGAPVQSVDEPSYTMSIRGDQMHIGDEEAVRHLGEDAYVTSGQTTTLSKDGERYNAGEHRKSVDDPSVSVRSAAPLWVGQEKDAEDRVRFFERNSGHRGMVEKDVDGPAPTLQAGGPSGDCRLRIETGAPLLKHPDTTFASQLTTDPKHPEKSIDEPATGIRGGGDGNDAPHYWLRQETTGTPAKTVDEPSAPVTGPGTLYLHDEDPGTRPQKLEDDRVGIERRRGPGMGERRIHPLDEPSPSVTANQATGGQAGLLWRTENPVKGAQEVDPDEPSTTIRAGGSVDAGGKQGGGAPPYLSYLHGENDKAPIDGPAPTIRAGGNQSGKDNRVEGGKAPYLVQSERPTLAGTQPDIIDKPSVTVTTTEAKGTRGDNMWKDLGNGKITGGPDRASDVMYLATGRRRLSVEECARLQGFPVDYPFQGNKTARYKQVGNAVAPPMAEALGKAILDS